ncbi:MAG: DUF748 domain-containing protein [bacterium]|nr:DUF748 domain-containing protein [bacterium]
MQTEPLPTQPEQSEPLKAEPRKKKSRLVKTIFIGVGVLLGLFIIAAGIGYWLYAGKIQSIITASANEYIKEVLLRDVANTGDSPISVELGLVDYDFFGRTLAIKDIHVVLGDVKDTNLAYMDIRLPIVHATGVNPWDILFGEGLSFGDIVIDEPTVYRRPGILNVADSITHKETVAKATARGAELDKMAGKKVSHADSVSLDSALVKLPRLPDIDSLVGSLLGALLPRNVKPLYINSVVVKDAAYVLAIAKHENAVGGSLSGLNIQFNSISIRDSTENYKTVGQSYMSVRQWRRPFDDGDTVNLFGGKVVINETDSSMHIDSVEYLMQKGMRTYASGIHLSFRDRTLAIDSFSVVPTITDAEYFAKTKYRTDRVRAGASTVVLKDIDTRGLVEGTALNAQTLDFKNFHIDVLSNSRAPRLKGKNPMMPFEIVASIPFQLGIDSIRVANTTIMYGELHKNSNTPATLQFERIGFLVTGLSNDPVVQKRQPVKIFGKGAFQKNGVMDLEITLPLNVTENTLDAKGTLSEMDLKTFNTFLPVAENIRVKKGWVKKASFNLKVRGRKSTGVVLPLYIDFELEVLNKKSKKVGFWEGIASFLANWLKIKNENVPGEDMKEGKINYTIPADAAPLQALWFPVRSGLGKVIGF